MLRKRTRIKLYRKLRYRKGYGIHSPFMYSLITKVIEENSPYYIFEDIEKERKRLLSQKNETGILTRKETQSKNYGALLFRLVNFFKPTTVLQIGSVTGIMSLYLANASKRCKYYFLEEREGLFDSYDFIQNHQLDNLIMKEGDYEVQLKELKTELPEVDLIHLNLRGDTEKTEKVIKLLIPFIHKNTILLIDGIGINKSMQKFWSGFIQTHSISVSLDLYALGIVFFDKKYHKQNFKNYIDYDKKQNLHRTGRQRFHFFGRRKKGK